MKKHFYTNNTDNMRKRINKIMDMKLAIKLLCYLGMILVAFVPMLFIHRAETINDIYNLYWVGCISCFVEGFIWNSLNSFINKTDENIKKGLKD